jgi:hypothetical protein
MRIDVFILDGFLSTCIAAYRHKRCTNSTSGVSTQPSMPIGVLSWPSLVGCPALAECRPWTARSKWSKTVLSVSDLGLLCTVRGPLLYSVGHGSEVDSVRIRGAAMLGSEARSQARDLNMDSDTSRCGRGTQTLRTDTAHGRTDAYALHVYILRRSGENSRDRHIPCVPIKSLNNF